MMEQLEVDPSNSGSELWTWPDRSAPWGPIWLFLTVVTAYALGNGLALLLIEASALQGVFFIPSGITVAFLLRLPRRLWWIVLVGAAMAEIVMDMVGGFSAGESIGFAVAHTAEPLVGALIVTAAVFPLDLNRRRDLIWFSVGAVLIGPAIGAALRAITDRVFAGDIFLTTFGQWWLGDALGVVLVAGAILAWGSSSDRRSLFSLGGIGLLAGSMALTVAILTFTHLPLMFSVLIGVVVAGALFGARAVAITALAVASIIAVMVANHPGVLILGLTPASAVVLIQLQVGMFALAGFLIAAESHERELATRHAAETALARKNAQQEQQRHREMALEVQRSLLPDRLVEHPKLQVAARYEAASDLLEVGGDWYDTISLDGGRIGLVIGDVVGHGTKAMIAMGRVRTALAALARQAEDPGSLLREVDEFIAGPDGTVYATVFYAIVDTEQHRIEYASAGHPPGLLVRPDGATTWLDRGQSGPLCGEPDSPRGHASIAFDPGASLVLYSDGLIERRHEPLEAGLRRLELLVADFADDNVDTICEELFERLGVGYSRDDDVVLMVARATTDSSSDYHEQFPARSEELARVRSSVRSWAETSRLGPATIDDLVLVVSEAASNCIRHAYQGTNPGSMEILISPGREFVAVAVRDGGKWKGSLDEVGDPGLGRKIIQSVTDDLEINTDANGTVVSFKLPAPGI